MTAFVGVIEIKKLSVKKLTVARRSCPVFGVIKLNPTLNNT